MNGEYPLHIVLNDRIFLNLFVYRLPSNSHARYPTMIGEDGNPLKYSKSQLEILKLISKWIVTFCEKHPLKENFGNLRSMAVLLKSKSFPLTRPSLSEIDAILPPNKKNINSRLIQESKLEALLHGGKASDLRKANELMKEMVLNDSTDDSIDDSIVLSSINANEKIDRGHDLCARFENAMMTRIDDEILKELKNELKNLRNDFEHLLSDENLICDSGIMSKIISCNERINDLISDDNNELTFNEESLIDLDDDRDDNNDHIVLVSSTSNDSINLKLLVKGCWIKEDDLLIQFIKTSCGKKFFLISNFGKCTIFEDGNYILKWNNNIITNNIPSITSLSSISIEVFEEVLGHSFIDLDLDHYHQDQTMEPEIIRNNS